MRWYALEGRLRDGRQGPDRQRQALEPDRRERSAGHRRTASTTSCSSTRRARRSPSRKGNGLTIDEWLGYASPESLALFMYQRPREAKKLHFDVIPRAVDEYLGLFGSGAEADARRRRASSLLGNPVWHLHSGACRRRPRCWPRPSVHDRRVVRDAAQPRHRGQQRGPCGAVGISAALRAGRVAADASAPRCAGDLCRGLLPRSRATAEEPTACPDEGRARGAARSSPTRSQPCPPAPRARTSRPRSTTSPGRSRATRSLISQRCDAGAARRVERLLRHALPGAARRGARAAVRERSPRCMGWKRAGRSSPRRWWGSWLEQRHEGRRFFLLPLAGEGGLDAVEVG